MAAERHRERARIALVVPVLNEAGELGALAQALRDAAARCEVVVVDGGSDDGTRRALDGLSIPSCPYSGVGLRVLDAPRGRAVQMNAGARATSAPLLLFLHADTRLPPDGFDAVERACGAGAVGGCFRVRIDSPDPRLKLAAGIINLRSRLMPSASGDQAIFVRRDVFARLGGYREVALCEDLDLVARLKRHGRFVLVDREVATSARRWRAHGVNRTIALMWTLRLAWHLGISPATLARWYSDAR
jgi:rSAM/selenodomain-associated transferase 2